MLLLRSSNSLATGSHCTNWAHSRLPNAVISKCAETLRIIQKLVLLRVVAGSTIHLLILRSSSSMLLRAFLNPPSIPSGRGSGLFHCCVRGCCSYLLCLSRLLLSLTLGGNATAAGLLLLYISTPFKQRSQLVISNTIMTLAHLIVRTCERSARVCSLGDMIWILENFGSFHATHIIHLLLHWSQM